MLYGEKGDLLPKYFTGDLQLSEPHGHRLCWFTKCPKRWCVTKDILTNEGAPTRIQINSTKFNATKKSPNPL